MFPGFSKNARFGPPQIYTRVFHLSLWTMLGMEILAHLNFFLLRVFARLEMRHIRNFSVVISNYAYWTF